MKNKAGGKQKQEQSVCGGPNNDKYAAGAKGEKNEDVTKVSQQEPGAEGKGEDYSGQQQQSVDSALLLLLAKDKYVARQEWKARQRSRS